MTKTQMVLEHLQNKGGITSMDAFTLYNATRLSAIIFELKKKGYNIITIDRETYFNDTKTRFAEYRLVDTKPEDCVLK